MTNIYIKLEPNADGRYVYYPSQFLRGAVELHLDKQRKIRAFYIKITGKAECHWEEIEEREVQTRVSVERDDRESEPLRSEAELQERDEEFQERAREPEERAGEPEERNGEPENRERELENVTRIESRTVHYMGKEKYLNSKTYLFGHQGASAVEVPAGLHTYTFAVELPAPIPESIIAPFGEISYHAEAVLDIPWRFDKEVKIPFTVARFDNLNTYPELVMPLKLDEIKTFCCLFCKSAPCVMTVMIPCGGFSPGKAIPIRVEYVNRSSKNVQQTRFKLIRKFFFRSSTPEYRTKEESETIVEATNGGVAKGQSANIEAAIGIPSFVNFSNGRFCEIIEVAYFLEIEGIVGGACSSNLRVHVPIQIGAIGVGEDAPMNYNQGFPQQQMPMVTEPFGHQPPIFDGGINPTMVNPNFSMGWNMPQN